jgi:hypothetical protein
MSDPIVTAAIPTVIAALQAAKQFIANLGTDPAQIPAKLPGAAAIFVGTLQLQVPVLAGAELGAATTDVNAKIDALIAKLQSIK